MNDSWNVSTAIWYPKYGNTLPVMWVVTCGVLDAVVTSLPEQAAICR